MSTTKAINDSCTAFHPPKQRRLARQRRGSAVVECAVTAPLLVLIVFCSIDVGQFIFLAQTVSNASRIGARLASRAETDDTSTVTSDVQAYMQAIGMPADSVKVTVYDAAGNPISGASLADVPSGDRVSVQVEVQYDAIRQVSFLRVLSGAANSSTATMRRE